MTRKPQQTGPTAEDISRHEEEVAKFLHEYHDMPEDAEEAVWFKKLPVSARLCLILGRCHAMYSFGSTPEEKLELTEQIAWLTPVAIKQLGIEALADQGGPG
jgi:hypothetical protein